MVPHVDASSTPMTDAMNVGVVAIMHMIAAAEVEGGAVLGETDPAHYPGIRNPYSHHHYYLCLTGLCAEIVSELRCLLAVLGAVSMVRLHTADLLTQVTTAMSVDVQDIMLTIACVIVEADTGLSQGLSCSERENLKSD